MPKSDSNTPFSVSVSIGVAMANPNEALSKLLNRADKVLYEAKASGRNTISLAARGNSVYAAAYKKYVFIIDK